jgi:Zn-finger protein
MHTHKKMCFYCYLFIYFCGAEDQTQDFAYVRQVLYH